MKTPALSKVYDDYTLNKEFHREVQVIRNDLSVLNRKIVFFSKVPNFDSQNRAYKNA